MKHVAVGDTTKMGTRVAPSAQSITLDPELQARLLAMRDKEEQKEALRRQVWRERRFLFPLLAVALACLPNFRLAQVQGHSMEPAYSPGDRLVMLKTYQYFSPVKVGDVVVIRLKHGKYKGEEWVKRVVFIQNDQGDAPWPESLKMYGRDIQALRYFPLEVRGFKKVPPRHIYVMGDNLTNSVDSRDDDLGAVAPDEIVGKVINN